MLIDGYGMSWLAMVYALLCDELSIDLVWFVKIVILLLADQSLALISYRNELYTTG